MVDYRTGLGSGSNSWVLFHVLKVISGYLWSGGSFHLSWICPTVGNSVAVRRSSRTALMFSLVVYIKVTFRMTDPKFPRRTLLCNDIITDFFSNKLML